MTLDTSTPVLLLGGKENALSICRHLGSLGIPVRASGSASCWALYSRHCKQAFKVPRGIGQRDYWHRLLLDGDDRLHGHILLAMSDDAIEFLNANRDRLAGNYILDEADPQLQADFLDKKRTLELARAAEVDAPEHWSLGSEDDLQALRGKIRYPVAVKPIQSHKFSAVFGRKLFVIDSSDDELAEKVHLAWRNGIDVFVVEMIPGPDSTLSSYYTYRTGDGGNLFHFTKSVIRRWPVNRGNACYHRTGWLPETAAAGAKFFEGVGLKGLGNIEFKRDIRDGKLKIIEVNARFTAAQELVRRAGVPIDLIIYCHLTGQPIPTFQPSKRELRFWYPLRDFLGFLELRRRGELSFWSWAKSIATTAHVFPLMSLTDPAPVLGAMVAVIYRLTA
ncbi:MAG: carboxylate--amine ligase [Alphaproteobacteria bacterium]|nr:carboxylate--amine ligase [Alphaproteobacteria bacterium]